MTRVEDKINARVTYASCLSAKTAYSIGEILPLLNMVETALDVAAAENKRPHQVLCLNADYGHLEQAVVAKNLMHGKEMKT